MWGGGGEAGVTQNFIWAVWAAIKQNIHMYGINKCTYPNIFCSNLQENDTLHVFQLTIRNQLTSPENKYNNYLIKLLTFNTFPSRGSLYSHR